jgi:hypothetical protein
MTGVVKHSCKIKGIKVRNLQTQSACCFIHCPQRSFDFGRFQKKGRYQWKNNATTYLKVEFASSGAICYD